MLASRRRGCGLVHNEHGAVLVDGQTQSLRSLFKGRVSRPLQQRMIGIVCRIILLGLSIPFTRRTQYSGTAPPNISLSPLRKHITAPQQPGE